MKFELTILGSSSATPIFNRHPTAQLLNIHETFILIDCGEATQMQLLRFGLKAGKIAHIFISHLHGDHYLGLTGLLSSLNLNGRRDELYLYGPAGLDRLLDFHFELSETTLNYPLHFTSTTSTPCGVLLDAETYTVESIELFHSIPCRGFVFREKARSRKIIREKISEYAIPGQAMPGIKLGASFTTEDGLLIPNSELTLNPPAPRAYAFCSDTRFEPLLAQCLKGINTLYHEATFLSDMEERATFTFHTTARQAGILARTAGVGKLLLGHFSARYRDLAPLLEEAKAEFEQSFLALEGLTFNL